MDATAIADSSPQMSAIQQAMSCPLTGQPFRDPVILVAPGSDVDAVSYELSALEARFAGGDFTDPASGAPLPEDFYVLRNTALQALVASAVRLGLLA